MRTKASVLVVVALVAACGGGQPAPTTPTPAPSPSATSPTAPTPASAPTSSAPTALPATWAADMPKDQQIAFMKQNVAPHMAKVFKEHDGSRYAEFSCKTCHGPKGQVPKDFLPRLTFKDGKITSFADKPEISKWMMEKVAPEMASAMGMKPFDPKTHEGFGCAGCHAVDMK